MDARVGGDGDIDGRRLGAGLLVVAQVRGDDPVGADGQARDGDRRRPGLRVDHLGAEHRDAVEEGDQAEALGDGAHGGGQVDRQPQLRRRDRGREGDAGGLSRAEHADEEGLARGGREAGAALERRDEAVEARLQLDRQVRHAGDGVDGRNADGPVVVRGVGPGDRATARVGLHRRREGHLGALRGRVGARRDGGDGRDGDGRGGHPGIGSDGDVDAGEGGAGDGARQPDDEGQGLRCGRPAPGGHRLLLPARRPAGVPVGAILAARPGPCKGRSTPGERGTRLPGAVRPGAGPRRPPAPRSPPRRRPPAYPAVAAATTACASSRIRARWSSPRKLSA